MFSAENMKVIEIGFRFYKPGSIDNELHFKEKNCFCNEEMKLSTSTKPAPWRWSSFGSHGKL